MPTLVLPAERKEEAEPMEDEGTILRKMRRLTDYYDIHKEIGRWVCMCGCLASLHSQRGHLIAVWALRVGLWEGGEGGESHLKWEMSHQPEWSECISQQMICFCLTWWRQAFTVNCGAIGMAEQADGKMCFPTVSVLRLLNRATKLRNGIHSLKTNTTEKHTKRIKVNPLCLSMILWLAQPI